MTAKITVLFTHTKASLTQAIKKATGFDPKIKLNGENFNNKRPVYVCEFDCTNQDDDKILKGLKKLHVTVGEIVASPAPINTDHKILRHKA